MGVRRVPFSSSFLGFALVFFFAFFLALYSASSSFRFSFSVFLGWALRNIHTTNKLTGSTTKLLVMAIESCWREKLKGPTLRTPSPDEDGSF